MQFQKCRQGAGSSVGLGQSAGSSGLGCWDAMMSRRTNESSGCKIRQKRKTRHDETRGDEGEERIAIMQTMQTGVLRLRPEQGVWRWARRLLCGGGGFVATSRGRPTTHAHLLARPMIDLPLTRLTSAVIYGDEHDHLRASRRPLHRLVGMHNSRCGLPSVAHTSVPEIKRERLRCCPRNTTVIRRPLHASCNARASRLYMGQGSMLCCTAGIYSTYG